MWQSKQILTSALHFWKSHRQQSGTYQKLWWHGVLLVWVRIEFVVSCRNIHYEIEKIAWIIHFCSVHFTFHPTP